MITQAILALAAGGLLTGAADSYHLAMPWQCAYRIVSALGVLWVLFIRKEPRP